MYSKAADILYPRAERKLQFKASPLLLNVLLEYRCWSKTWSELYVTLFSTHTYTHTEKMLPYQTEQGWTAICMQLKKLRQGLSLHLTTIYDRLPTTTACSAAWMQSNKPSKTREHFFFFIFLDTFLRSGTLVVNSSNLKSGCSLGCLLEVPGVRGLQKERDAETWNQREIIIKSNIITTDKTMI